MYVFTPKFQVGCPKMQVDARACKVNLEPEAPDRAVFKLYTGL